MADAEPESVSDGEPDSDPEDHDLDPSKLLDGWLDQLHGIGGNKGVDGSWNGENGGEKVSPPSSANLRMDSYRFSMINLEDSQDVELDAILGELSALETQFEKELGYKPGSKTSSQANSSGTESHYGAPHTTPQVHHVNGRPQVSRPQGLDLHGMRTEGNEGNRTESPDADSAFSDNVSMLSSESSTSSGGSGGNGNGNGSSQTPQRPTQPLTPSKVPEISEMARVKAEKIRLALEKIKEANVKKLFVKVFGADGGSKSLLVDEKMSVGHVMRLLADKNHIRLDPKWGLVEHLPHLLMERAYEDHENLVENLLMWTRDSKNRLYFMERREKNALFCQPEMFLLGTSSSQRDRILDEESRTALLEEFFAGSGVGVPEVEGYLFLKSEGKKVWRKHWCILRASGLYYSPKGSHRGRSSKDLVCLATFEVNQVYYGVGWKRKYKAPSEFCFALKHPQLQAKSAKYIKYLCAEDSTSLHQWVTGIRIAKFGHQLVSNYRKLMDDMTQEDIDRLAQERGFSMALPPSVPTMNGSPASQMSSGTSRRSSSSSSGCMSERSSASTPTAEQGFECEFAGPMGTIKRKPSMAPRLPLTVTTRMLVKESGMDSVPRESPESPPEAGNADGEADFPPPPPEAFMALPGALLGAGSEESLPPPPSPMMKQSTSLDSLPPPPPPETSTCDGKLYDTCSQRRATSEEPYFSLVKLRKQHSMRVEPSPSSQSVPKRPAYPQPPPKPSLLSMTSPRKTAAKGRKISFKESPTEIEPPSTQKPVFLREAGRGSLRQQQSATPPRAFLKDLQRVMQKKWQVAQKLKQENRNSPYEVMGFRDPNGSDVDDAYVHVGRWIYEHYGGPPPEILPPQPRESPSQPGPTYGGHPGSPGEHPSTSYGPASSHYGPPSRYHPPHQNQVYDQSGPATSAHQIYGVLPSQYGSQPIYMPGHQALPSQTYGTVPIQPRHGQSSQIYSIPPRSTPTPVSTGDTRYSIPPPASEPIPYYNPDQWSRNTMPPEYYGQASTSCVYEPLRPVDSVITPRHAPGLYRQTSFGTGDGIRMSQRKRPPPPPPKRSETTHLSVRQP